MTRVFLIMGFTLLTGTLIAALWYVDGFATASEKPPEPPGTAITNDLFTVTLHEAEITTEEMFGESSQVLQIRADLRSREREPVRASTIAEDLMDVELLPSGDSPDSRVEILLERRSEAGLVTWIQPDMPETMLLRWPLPEGLQAEDVEQVRVVVLEAEFASGFTDQTLRWRSTLNEDVAAYTVLPAGEG